MGKLNKKLSGMTLLVVFLLFLTGLFRLIIDNSENLLLNITGTLLIFTIYISMLFAWSISIWRRVMHIHIRRYLMWIVGLMLFWIFIRTLRDTYFNLSGPLARWLWYGYYISMILIPLFSVFAALCLGKPENWRPKREIYFLFIPAVFLIFGILTNDFHQFAFGFPLGIERSDSFYTHHILYYLAVFWIAGFSLVEVAILFKKSYIPNTKKWVWRPLSIIGIGLIYTVLYSIDCSKNRFGFIEITAMLCTLTAGVWESCIQTGLLPSNSKYEVFFDESSLGIEIVDDQGTEYYKSAFSEPIPFHVFEELKETGCIQVDQNTQLYASPIKKGYVIWRENIANISLLIRELENTKDELMDEVDLLKEELRAKQRKLRVDERNRLHNLTLQQIMPQIKKIKQYLAFAPQADEVEKNQLLWKINVIGAYIKRRTNLVLMADGKESVTVNDLTRCLEESLANIKIEGIDTDLTIDTINDMFPEYAVLLYDFFEVVVEAVLSKLQKLSVIVTDKGNEIILSLKLNKDIKQLSYAVENWKKEELAAIGATIQCETKDEDKFFIAIHIPKGVR